VRLFLLAVVVLLLGAGSASAYVGPGGGLELGGYFLSLLMWAGSAFGMILLWPFYSLVRRFRGTKGGQPEEEKDQKDQQDQKDVKDE
jgi:hypothetical protein